MSWDAMAERSAIAALLDFDGDSWPVALVLKDEPPPHDREPKVSTTKPRARKRPATPRLRNKAKIELLRREIASLEAELEALQQSKRTRAIQPQSHTSQPADSLSAWKGIASRQSKEREQAQLRNQGLKKMISEQHTLTMSLSSVLNEWTRLPLPASTLSACV
ncbi:hypothetical protein PF005_g24471 [Phytophthora fragariae]|uniref:Uncharacterized protein n=1 Tax=Phytophthora fragariae TaxID=53985 RepID=A0A6A3QFR8_9STRA|nr:hypothetical protein PF009_g24445 [Phytophthora fragariae]KAE9075138.1 hypothetical protein PF010_g24426 [Phytophthora fragariae]KAE9075491.1 hypothetical protein PF007_g24985 [Phytophthora fragariae]KAE9094600.1 hypothetical protein PF006_g24183 [Phytophthora fragariae]KAE9177496.1 hypothetical protein PF005_g24471 [Phytophthora fragariae]